MTQNCFIAFIAVLISLQLSAQKSIQVVSPDGNIRFELKLEDQLPEYKVSFNGRLLIEHAPKTTPTHIGKPDAFL
jgi:hypothetical protein